VISLHPMRRAHVRPVALLERALFAEEPWSERTLIDELSEPGRYYLVAQEDDDEIVGYAGLADFGSEAHVMTLGVRADRQRVGLGARLLTALLDEAATRRIGRVLLEVAVDNEAARRLYTRYGFEPIGIRKRYYQATGTDAVVMVRE
jgi:ribosomal-protein-alanine N-acetyltransferase